MSLPGSNISPNEVFVLYLGSIFWCQKESSVSTLIHTFRCFVPVVFSHLVVPFEQGNMLLFILWRTGPNFRCDGKMVWKKIPASSRKIGLLTVNPHSCFWPWVALRTPLFLLLSRDISYDFSPFPGFQWPPELLRFSRESQPLNLHLPPESWVIQNLANEFAGCKCYPSGN